MTDKQEYVTANLSQKILWQLIGRKIMWETGKKALKANQTLFSSANGCVGGLYWVRRRNICIFYKQHSFPSFSHILFKQHAFLYFSHIVQLNFEASHERNIIYFKLKEWEQTSPIKRDLLFSSSSHFCINC